jgi:hypothetical protein
LGLAQLSAQLGEQVLPQLPVQLGEQELPQLPVQGLAQLAWTRVLLD